MKGVRSCWELTAFLCVVFGVFPLFYTDYYYNIQASKSWFFVGAVCAFFLLSIITGALFATEGLNIKSWKLWDILPVASVFLFLIWAVISTLVSDDVKASLYGSNGRHIGLIWIVACVLAVLMSWAQRNRHPKLISLIYAVAFVIVIMIGLEHGLGHDIGGFLEHVPEKFTRMYISTIGYVNFFSQFASFGAVVCTGLYCRYGYKWLLPVIFVSYIGLILGNSDAGVIGWFVTIILFPVLLIKERKNLEDFLLCTVLLAPACILMHLIYPRLIGYPAQSTLCEILMRIPVAIIILIVTLGLYILSKALKSPNITGLLKVLKIVIPCILGAAVIVFVLANTGIWNNSMLTVNDSWGSNRGYIWRKVIEIYKQSPLIRKLFGYGPDGMLPVMNAYCHDESIAVTGQIFDSAHNDFLQYMITIGLPGAIMYLAFWITAIIAGIKRQAQISKVWLMAVICYAVQALLVPSQPMTTPLAFVFVGMMMGGEVIKDKKVKGKRKKHKTNR